MSWSIQGISGLSETEAKAKLTEQSAPQEIKDYVAAGIHGLVKQYGADVKVTVTAHGHLHNGTKSDYDVTSATVKVEKSE